MRFLRILWRILCWALQAVLLLFLILLSYRGLSEFGVSRLIAKAQAVCADSLPIARAQILAELSVQQSEIFRQKSIGQTPICTLETRNPVNLFGIFMRDPFASEWYRFKASETIMMQFEGDSFACATRLGECAPRVTRIEPILY